MMKAAVVSSFGTGPHYGDFPAPSAAGEHQMVVDVLAAGLHVRVRSQADGSHYTSTGELPLVPGVDGVGRGPDGRERYFVIGDTALGSMAEQTLIDTRRAVVLPDGSDAVAVAAGMNPAMSSWVALRRRTSLEPGQDVLILGATGSSGRLAVQVAALLGANRIVAAGRDESRLAELPGLGATETVRLDEDGAGKLAAAASDVDVVIDYLWGEVAAAALTSIVTARPDRGKPLTWIEIGAMAGPTAAIPSAALRSSRLTIVGSGQGSVSTADIASELPAIAGHLSDGTLRVSARPVPLADVSEAWADTGADGRVVLVP
jgi:NADPH:quinone reductase-like Zn-dependent oxidoreductase